MKEAIADYSKSIDLEATRAGVFYSRGEVYRGRTKLMRL